MKTYHFLHIHKTGGTSVTEFLRTQISDENIFPGTFDHQLLRAPVRDTKFGLYTGHLSIGRVPDEGGETRLITMLRNPRQRLLSAFGHWRAQAEEYRHAVPPKTGFLSLFLEMSLEEFLCAETPMLKRLTGNVQARLLAGGQYGTAKSTRAQVFGPDLSDDETVEAATRTLKTCFYFGFTEALDASILRLAELGQWPRPAETFRSKVTPSWARPTSVPAIAEEKLRQATRLDDRIYQVARTIYQDRFGDIPKL